MTAFILFFYYYDFLLLLLLLLMSLGNKFTQIVRSSHLMWSADGVLSLSPLLSPSLLLLRASPRSDKDVCGALLSGRSNLSIDVQPSLFFSIHCYMQWKFEPKE